MTVEDRVAKLENQNRVMRRCGVLAVAAVALVLLTAQGKEDAAVNAKSLAVRDEAGRVRAALRMDDGAPVLLMWDEEGEERVRLGALKCSSLSLKDRGGRERLVLDVRHDGAPSVMLNDIEGRYRLLLKVNEHGEPEMSLWDAEAKVRGAFGVRLGVPKLFIADRSMRERAVLGVVDRGDGHRTAESALTLFDAEGNVIWQAN